MSANVRAHTRARDSLIAEMPAPACHLPPGHDDAGIVLKSKPPTFILTLRPESSDVPAIVRLRRALKVLLRVFGLRCIDVASDTMSEDSPIRTGQKPGSVPADQASIDIGHTPENRWDQVKKPKNQAKKPKNGERDRNIELQSGVMTNAATS